MLNHIVKTSRRWLALTLGIGVALTVSVPVWASDAESVLKLSLLAAKFENETGGTGRSRVNGRYLKEGKTYTIETTLYTGNTYAIIGAGDSTVEDLDIELFDENWGPIDRDSQTDAYPIVKVNPKWSGTFYIRVKMYSGRGFSNAMICSVAN